MNFCHHFVYFAFLLEFLSKNEKFFEFFAKLVKSYFTDI